MSQSQVRLFLDLEAELEQFERQLLELNRFHEKLNTEFNENKEMHEVLEKSEAFFDAVPTSSMLDGGDGGISIISRTRSPLSLGTSNAKEGGDSAARLLDEDYGMETTGMGVHSDFAMSSPPSLAAARGPRAIRTRPFDRPAGTARGLRHRPADTNVSLSAVAQVRCRRKQ